LPSTNLYGKLTLECLIGSDPNPNSEIKKFI
jgi:hypothetical protein